MADAATTVIDVHFNELNLQRGSSKRQNIGVVIEFDLVVQLNPRDLGVVL